MPATAAAKNEWVRTFLHVTPPQSGEDEQKGGFSKFFKKKEKPAPSVAPTLVMPTDANLLRDITALGTKLAALKDQGFDTATMESNRADMASRAIQAEAIVGDPARANAIAAVQKTVTEALQQADTLSSSITDTMGTKKGPPNTKQKSAIFQKAMKDQYGITIQIPKGMKNTHLDRVYDMFGMVPKEHANQDMLKTLLYRKDWGESGAYNKDELAVKMGDFGKADGSETYEIDGTPYPANSFDVTTLHEIGHAVDNNNGVMRDHGDKPGCGDWKAETVDSVTAAYLKEAKAKLTLTGAVTDPILTAVIKTALEAGTTAKPDTIGNPDWQAIIPFLTDKCLPIRTDNSPWFETTQIVIGERVYQQAYASRWVSYAFAARAATRVNDYQWRAPGEWFAEIYAITWLKKKSPPTAIAPEAAEYMWKPVS